MKTIPEYFLKITKIQLWNFIRNKIKLVYGYIPIHNTIIK